MNATEVVEQLHKLPLAEQREVFEQLRDEFDNDLTPESRFPSTLVLGKSHHQEPKMAKPPPRKPKKKVCQFCKDKVTYVDYKDTGLLRKYISDRGKIRARRVSGNCTQHQRDVAMAVKNSREMALLPYTSLAR